MSYEYIIDICRIDIISESFLVTVGIIVAYIHAVLEAGTLFISIGS